MSVASLHLDHSVPRQTSHQPRTSHVVNTPHSNLPVYIPAPGEDSACPVYTESVILTSRHLANLLHQCQVSGGRSRRQEGEGETEAKLSVLITAPDVEAGVSESQAVLLAAADREDGEACEQSDLPRAGGWYSQSPAAQSPLSPPTPIKLRLGANTGLLFF